MLVLAKGEDPGTLPEKLRTERVVMLSTRPHPKGSEFQVHNESGGSHEDPRYS